MNGQFLNAAAQLLASQEVRKFQLEWGWQARGRLYYAKTVWHGRDRENCLARFLKAVPQAINVRVIEEVGR